MAKKLTETEQKIWDTHFKDYVFSDVMSLRGVYNNGCRTKETRECARVYKRFRDKVRACKNNEVRK